MDFIDRYLHSVRGYLPKGNQDDIVNELRDDIRAQAADRAEEAGRPLTPDEEAAILKGFGHPMLLAAKYRPSQHLISSVVFPFYWFALKLACGIAVTVQAAMAIAMVVNGEPAGPVIGRLASFPFTGLVTLFGWITLAFAVIDVNARHVANGLADSWDPRVGFDLPKELGPKSFWSAGLELVFSTVGLGWWLAIPSMPFLVFGPAAAFMAMGDSWKAIHVPIAGLWLASLVVGWTLLFRPGLRALRIAFAAAQNVVGLVVAFVLLRSDAIITMAPGFDPGDRAAEVARLVHNIDAATRIGIVIWVAASVWEFVKLVLRRGDGQR